MLKKTFLEDYLEDLMEEWINSRNYTEARTVH